MNIKLIAIGTITILCAIWGTAFGLNYFGNNEPYGAATIATGMLTGIMGLICFVGGIDKTLLP